MVTVVKAWLPSVTPSRTAESTNPRRTPTPPATDAEDGGLGYELEHDVAAFCSDSFAYAYLAGALGDRYQHDIHDADAPNKEGDASDGPEEDDESLSGLLHGLQQVLLIDDGEVALARNAMAQAKDCINLAGGRVHGLFVRHLNGDAVDGDCPLGGALGAEAVVGGGDGYQGLEVLSDACAPSRFEDPYDGELATVQAYALPNRVSEAEKLLRQLRTQYCHGRASVQVMLPYELARGNGSQTHRFVAGRHSDNLGRGVGAPVYHLGKGIDFGGHVYNRGV